MRKAFLVSAILFNIGSANAAEMAVMGMGVSTCSEFATSYQQSPQQMELVYFSWAQGFMSGLNSKELLMTGNSQNLNSISTEAQERLIRSYCNDNPLAEYESAVRYLYSQFAPSARITPPKSGSK